LLPCAQASAALHGVASSVLKALAFFFNVPTYTFVGRLLDDEVLQPGAPPSSLLHAIRYKQPGGAAAAAALEATQEDEHEDRGVLTVVSCEQPGLQVGVWAGGALAAASCAERLLAAGAGCQRLCPTRSPPLPTSWTR
jgi:hypothetical protein